jgi:hypothetical protein
MKWKENTQRAQTTVNSPTMTPAATPVSRPPEEDASNVYAVTCTEVPFSRSMLKACAVPAVWVPMVLLNELWNDLQDEK